MYVLRLTLSLHATTPALSQPTRKVGFHGNGSGKKGGFGLDDSWGLSLNYTPLRMRKWTAADTTDV